MVILEPFVYDLWRPIGWRGVVLHTPEGFEDAPEVAAAALTRMLIGGVEDDVEVGGERVASLG
jgi:hypothetical protein